MDGVRKVLKANRHMELVTDSSGNERVSCKLTGHQLPCRVSDIVAYTQGKKYQRLLKALVVEEEKLARLDEEYKEHLVPSEKRMNQLYCKLTKKLINNLPHHIKLHVKGKRFQKALELYKENKKNGESQDKVEQDDVNVWQPSVDILESDSEPEVCPLPDSFDEEDEEEVEKGGDDDEEVEKDEEEICDDVEDDEKNSDRKDEIERINVNKKRNLTLKDKKEKTTKKKPIHTRKRELPEESVTTRAQFKKKKQNPGSKSSTKKISRKK